MPKLAEVIADALEAEVASRTEWDEAPALYAMRAAAGRCELAPVPLPDVIWAQARPPEVLMSLAVSLRDDPGAVALLRRFVPPDLHGVAWRCEQWVVKGTRDTDAEVTAMARARKLYQHPERAEERAIWAVDRAGITYGAMQERGSGEVRRVISYKRAGTEGTFTGTVPSALDALVQAFLGTVLSERPSCEDSLRAFRRESGGSA